MYLSYGLLSLMVGSYTVASGSSVTGSVESPNYPSDYDRDVDQDWSILVSTNHVVHIEVAEFQTEHNRDIVKVYDNRNNSLLYTWSGNIASGEVFSITTYDVKVHFRSDSAVEFTGFKLDWYATWPNGSRVLESGLDSTTDWVGTIFVAAGFGLTGLFIACCLICGKCKTSCKQRCQSWGCHKGRVQDTRPGYDTEGNPDVEGTIQHSIFLGASERAQNRDKKTLKLEQQRGSQDDLNNTRVDLKHLTAKRPNSLLEIRRNGPPKIDNSLPGIQMHTSSSLSPRPPHQTLAKLPPLIQRPLTSSNSLEPPDGYFTEPLSTSPSVAPPSYDELYS